MLTVTERWIVGRGSRGDSHWVTVGMKMLFAVMAVLEPNHQQPQEAEEAQARTGQGAEARNSEGPWGQLLGEEGRG